jgi:N-formylglutamate amidohydrolase
METIFPPVILRHSSIDTPVIIALPHSGSHYPQALRQLSRLSALTLRRSEDAYLDALLDFAPTLGITIIATPFARAYIDVNRCASDVDPLLIGKPRLHKSISDRAAAGLGVVPRVVGSGVEIYGQPLAPEIVPQRIAEVHAPYHAALAALIADTKARHGFAVVLDFHSMPSGKSHGRPLANIVLGDRRGQSCAAEMTGIIEDCFMVEHIGVMRNDPYAGGYTTECYGAPHAGVHVLQIEIDRSLYMDEAQVALHSGFAPLRSSVDHVLNQFMAQLPTLTAALEPSQPRPLAAE